MKRRLLRVLLVTALMMLTVCFAAAAAEEIPVLSETYPGAEVKLRTLDDESARIYANAGPGKTYVGGGWGYKPYKQKQITAYFIENDRVLVDIKYQTVEERFLYFHKDCFVSIPGSLPVVSDLPFYTGTANSTILPAWGPGSEFNRVDDYTVPQGTPIKAFFQENGFVYAEYQCNKGLIRMWLPADQVTLDNASATITDETDKDYRISQFGKGSSNGGNSSGTNDGTTIEQDCYYCDSHYLTVTDKIVGSFYEDDSGHFMIHEITWICPKCGATWSDRSEWNDFRAHSYGSDNVCTVCGYRK